MDVLTFALADKEYGFKLSQVSRIVRMKKITPVPGAGGSLQGVIDLDGRVVPVINLCKKLGLPLSAPASVSAKDSERPNRIIISRLDGHSVGIAVDADTEVVSFKDPEITAASDDEMLKKSKYLSDVARHADRLIFIVDIKRLISGREQRRIKGVADSWSSPKEVKRPKREFFRLLSFALGQENYCIDIKEAKEVVKLGLITKVPHTPEFILGVMDLHGEIITLIDLRYFLRLEPERIRRERARIVISEVDGATMGVLVDRINGALDVAEELVQPPIATLEEGLAEFTKGEIKQGNEILVFLELKKVLQGEEINRLKNS